MAGILRKNWCWLALALGLSLAFPAAAAPELPRRGWLGAALAPAEDGVRLVSVIEGGSLAAAGARPDDILVAVNGRTGLSAQALAQSMRNARSGERVTFTVLRDGRRLTLRGRARLVPDEHYPAATVRYGAVASQGGLLRTISAMPVGVTAPPVVFFIQGYTCSSVEAAPGNPENEFANLAADFTAAGIGFYRVEKLGVGDSTGPLHCLNVDFATEQQGFLDAYRDLVAQGVSEDRIYILGHSMGGIQAPLLAAENHPRGVAVFGTLLKNWADYMLDLDRLQDFFKLDADPVEAYAQTERHREAVHRFFFRREPLAKIVADYPQEREGLTHLFAWDGKTFSFGRNEVFEQDLAKLNLPEAWKNTHACVLSLYGETDIEALTGQDQRHIADMVNHYRPATAAYVELPGTMHFMDLVGNRAALQAHIRARGYRAGPFNHAVPAAIIQWIRFCGSRPVMQ